jgi:hypothetical protein
VAKERKRRRPATFTLAMKSIGWSREVSKPRLALTSWMALMLTIDFLLQM